MSPLYIALHALIAVLIAAVGYLVGRLVRWALARGLARVGFDDWFRRFNIGRAILRSGYAAGEFFGSVAAWLIYLTFVLLAAAYLAYSLGYPAWGDALIGIVNVYVYGFVKFFIIAIVGFILVDGFVEYVYRGAILKEDSRLLAPVAEYVRVVLYLVVITFALQQGGIDVSTLSQMLIPITWGLVAAMVAVAVLQAVRR
ncbi:MAG: mechanosensitive ion channel family protein [Thermoproteus sp.]